MRKKAKRILAMALTVVMLMGVMPTQAFAANTADTAGLLAPQQISDSGAASDEEEEETVIISPPADPEEGETEAGSSTGVCPASLAKLKWRLLPMKLPKGQRSRMQKKKRIRTKTILTALVLMPGRHRWRSLLLNLRLERPTRKAL